MIIDRLREQLNLRVVVWNSVICIDHIRPNRARPPTNHTTHEGPVQPCGPVRFSVAAQEPISVFIFPSDYYRLEQTVKRTAPETISQLFSVSLCTVHQLFNRHSQPWHSRGNGLIPIAGYLPKNRRTICKERYYAHSQLCVRVIYVHYLCTQPDEYSVFHLQIALKWQTVLHILQIVLHSLPVHKLCSILYKLRCAVCNLRCANCQFTNCAAQIWNCTAEFGSLQIALRRGCGGYRRVGVMATAQHEPITGGKHRSPSNGP